MYVSMCPMIKTQVIGDVPENLLIVIDQIWQTNNVTFIARKNNELLSTMISITLMRKYQKALKEFLKDNFKRVFRKIIYPCNFSLSRNCTVMLQISTSSNPFPAFLHQLVVWKASPTRRLLLLPTIHFDHAVLPCLFYLFYTVTSLNTFHQCIHCFKIYL